MASTGWNYMVHCKSLQGWQQMHSDYGTNKVNQLHKYHQLSVTSCMLSSVPVPVQHDPRGKTLHYAQYKSHYSQLQNRTTFKLPIPGQYGLNHIQHTLFSSEFHQAHFTLKNVSK
jgi:hypothetical protein